MSALFNEVLYRPLLNLLIGTYNIVPGNDFGIAVIALTVLIRFLFAPLSIRAVRSQRAMARINPEMEAIKEKFKSDPAAQSAAVMELYRKHKINPLAGCLPLLVQIPILIALYQALLAGFQPESLKLLYGFVENPGVVQTLSFGFLNIAVKNPVLAILAGVLQFVQSKLSVGAQNTAGGKANPTMAALNTQMLYFFPLMIILISWNLPAGLTLYWVTTTVFSIAEQAFIRYQDRIHERSQNTATNPH